MSIQGRQIFSQQCLVITLTHFPSMEQLKNSKHLECRQQQRGIRTSTLKMAQKYGEQRGDKLFFGKKQIDIALNKLAIEKSQLLKAKDQGGIISIDQNGILITAYRIGSFKKNKLRRQNYAF